MFLEHPVALEIGTKTERSTRRLVVVLKGSVRVWSVRSLTCMATEKGPGLLGTTMAWATPRSSEVRRVKRMIEVGFEKKEATECEEGWSDT